jgi:tetratricopeptide (TPR) repeat protein
MRIYITIILVLILCVSGFSQKKKKSKDADITQTEQTNTVKVKDTVTSVTADTKAERIKLLENIYLLALKYLDASVAQNALFELIALQPEKSSLKDSLAYIYYNLGKYGSAISIATDLLSADPNNLQMLEIRATSNENLKLLTEALLDYEKLYLRTQEIDILYHISFLQLQTKRYQECAANIEFLLNSKDTEQLKVSVNKNQIQMQEVPMRASLLNLKGLLFLEQGNKALAKENFQAALKLAPDFEIPKNNLAEMAKQK